MAILNNKLKNAESIYLEQNQVDKAINMYQKMHKWNQGNFFEYSYSFISALCAVHVLSAIVMVTKISQELPLGIYYITI